MTTNLNGMTLPSCEILVNGQKRKLYGKNKNKVYLQNGDNFQLKFFNPLQERIGAQLSMNGSKIDNDLLVLNPGQEMTIERYIGTNRKLTFSAYDIDTSKMSEERVKEATKAIEKNGILEVTFWNEKLAPPVYITNTQTTFNPHGKLFTNTPIFEHQGGTSTTNINIHNLIITNLTGSTITNTGTSGSTGNKGMSGTSGLPWEPGTLGAPGTSGAPSGTSNTSGPNYSEYLAEQFDRNIDYSNYLSDTFQNFSTVDYAPQELSRGIVSGTMNLDRKLRSKSIETGRIEKGSVSNQYFSQIVFEVGIPFYKIKFKLLPFSLKPLKKNSMTQQL